MDEHFSLSDVRSNEGITHSALTEVLDDCKELKSWMEVVCRRRQENIIRRGPAATTADNDSTFSTSTTLVGSNQSSKLDSPSSSYETSPSESSVPPNTALTNGSHPGPSCPSTDTSDSTVSSCNAEPHKTPSNTSAGSNTSPASTKKSTWPRTPPTDSDCMIFGGDSFVGSPTFNIDSDGATGARQRLPPTGARRTQAGVIRSPNRVVHFSPGAIVHSPTMNIQSPGASGAQYYA
ncbi:hypothetical protein P692DRAFT_201057197 [Suillus brevipes Sb2]|nr:hypothetical protein P692DRAFT_201057197 [Suillus brevipes Sb2]